jgi:hypothetical protein
MLSASVPNQRTVPQQVGGRLLVTSLHYLHRPGGMGSPAALLLAAAAAAACAAATAGIQATPPPRPPMPVVSSAPASKFPESPAAISAVPSIAQDTAHAVAESESLGGTVWAQAYPGWPLMGVAVDAVLPGGGPGLAWQSSLADEGGEVIPPQLRAAFAGVTTLSIVHPTWTGVRSAAYSQLWSPSDALLELPVIRDDAHARALATLAATAMPRLRAVVFQGVLGGSLLAVDVLREALPHVKVRKQA